jgi:hypothetical protein
VILAFERSNAHDLWDQVTTYWRLMSLEAKAAEESVFVLVKLVWLSGSIYIRTPRRHVFLVIFTLVFMTERG